MFSFIIISAIYWLFCVAWFSAVQKPMFGLFNRKSARSKPGLRDIADVYRHGNVSDRIIASYLTAVPLAAGAVCPMVSPSATGVVMTVYNVVIALALGLLVTADTVLYSFWKYKIDTSVFVYLKSLKGATASVSSLYLAAALSAWVLVSATFFLGAECVIRCSSGVFPAHPLPLPWWGYIADAIALAAGLGVLFAVIRGLGIRPNNPSIVYFSSDPFLNHWALNPAYNMIYSISVKDEFEGRFQTMPQKECDEITAGLFPVDGKPTQQLLRTHRPDIMLIIWESLSAEYSGFFGGREPSTPCLDALAREGIAFTDCSAGGFRTDRGLVAILSGYPAQPTTSVIRHTRKLPNLPGLARTLGSEGYRTVAIHGGDLSIMHKNDYYLACGHERLIGQKDMPRTDDVCKWGIHDGPAMRLAADELTRMHGEGRGPVFITLQTLSSHEPFEVPRRELPDKVRNAFAYTDHCLGCLVEDLKKSGTWDNLLLVVVADHGLNLPRPVEDRREFSHIPMVMAGGAVKGPARITAPMSQTDLAATLLGQLGISHRDFIFSRDVTADTYTVPFGIHVFHNGIMLADTEGKTVVDTMLDKVIEGTDDPVRRKRIAAILQKIYHDLSLR